jgi:hypothetical protein
MTDWVCRGDDDWRLPANGLTRWIIREHNRLTLETCYEVLGIEADHYRILDDQFDPVLYDPSGFLIVDSSEPAFWECSEGEDMERYCYPAPWNTPGFFEDYHDHVEDARLQFARLLKDLYPETWKRTQTFEGAG